MYFREKSIILSVLTLVVTILFVGQSFAAQKWKIGHTGIPKVDNPYHATGLKFKELVAKGCDEEIKVNIFPQSQLGGDRENLEAVANGLVEVTLNTVGPVSAFAPMVGLLELPFLFKSTDHLDAVLDGPIGRKILDQLGKSGVKGLGFFDDGINNITNSKRPIRSAADFKGLQMRVIEGPIRSVISKSLGANPVPMAYSELYTALQTGVVDGQSNPNWVTTARNLWEVQKYISVTNHIWGGAVLAMNLDLFNSLSAHDQKVVLEASQIACRHGRDVGRKSEERHLQTAIKNGMIVEHNPDVESMRIATEPVYDIVAKTYPDWIETIEKIKELGKQY